MQIKISAFVKEDLPTWNEVYNDYYQDMFLRNDGIYLADHPGEDDVYWKIPRRKYILAIVCNQFNKMIFYDGFKDDLLKLINREIFSGEIHENAVAYGVRFGIKKIKNLGRENDPELSDEDKKELENTKFNTPEFVSAIAGSDPYIYTIPHPEGKVNPFISSTPTVPRININDVEGDLFLHPMISVYDSKRGDAKDNYYMYTPNPDIANCYDHDTSYTSIIEFMMTPYKEYYDGINNK